MTSLLFPALILSAVLVISGIAKLLDPEGVEAAFRDLAVPSALDRPWLRTLFPWAEIALAVALLVAPGWSAPIAALAAAVLFGAYWALIYQALGTDEPVACNCFGKASSEPVTHWTLWRNTAFVILSIVWLIASFWGSAPRRWSAADGGDAVWILGMAAAAGTLFLAIAPAARRAAEAKAAAARTDADVAAPAAAGPSGSPADAEAGPIAPVKLDGEAEEEYIRRAIPPLAFATAHGEMTQLKALAARQARLLLFVSPGCGSCSRIIKKAPTWSRKLSPTVAVHLLTQAPQESLEAVAPDEVRENSLYDVARLAGEIGLRGTPSAVLLGADGLLAGGPVVGGDVEGFVDQIMGELEAAEQGQGPQPESA